VIGFVLSMASAAVAQDASESRRGAGRVGCIHVRRLRIRAAPIAHVALWSLCPCGTGLETPGGNVGERKLVQHGMNVRADDSRNRSGKQCMPDLSHHAASANTVPHARR